MKENQAKLFNSIIQFNPGKLQKGQGSGLGLFSEFKKLFGIFKYLNHYFNFMCLSSFKGHCGRSWRSALCALPR